MPSKGQRQDCASPNERCSVRVWATDKTIVRSRVGTGGQTEMRRQDVAASVRYNSRFGCGADDTGRGLGIPDKEVWESPGSSIPHTGDGFFG